MELFISKSKARWGKFNKGPAIQHHSSDGLAVQVGLLYDYCARSRVLEVVPRTNFTETGLALNGLGLTFIRSDYYRAGVRFNKGK